MAYCHECGKKADASDKHCKQCGASLKASSIKEAKKEVVREVIREPASQAQQTTVVHAGGGFFSSLFQGVGGAIGCCIGALIILAIIVAIANSS